MRVVGELSCVRRERSACRRPPPGMPPRLCERRGYYRFRVRCRERLVCDVKLPVPGTPQRLERGGGRGAGQPLRRERHGDSHGARTVHRPAGAGCSSWARCGTWPCSTIMPIIRPKWRPRSRRSARCTRERRLWCVFQPHQASRLARLAGRLRREPAQCGYRDRGRRRIALAKKRPIGEESRRRTCAGSDACASG